MPAANKLTIAALLAISMSLAGCNSSKKASSADTAAATAAGPAASDSGAADATAPAAAISAPAVAISAPAAGGASATGGCTLTAAQVSSAMGATYGDPQNFNGICIYAGSSNSLSIHVLDGTGVNNFAGTLATAVQDQGTDTTTAISGLGDKATGVGQEIVVQSGGKVIDIRGAENGFGSWPKSIALAKLVIAGLH